MPAPLLTALRKVNSLCMKELTTKSGLFWVHWFWFREKETPLLFNFPWHFGSHGTSVICFQSCVFSRRQMPLDLYNNNHVRKRTLLILRCECLAVLVLDISAVMPLTLRAPWQYVYADIFADLPPYSNICHLFVSAVCLVFFYHKNIWSSGTLPALYLSNKLCSWRLK